jgi:hypothetical protein
MVNVMDSARYASTYAVTIPVVKSFRVFCVFRGSTFCNLASLLFKICVYLRPSAVKASATACFQITNGARLC